MLAVAAGAAAGAAASVATHLLGGDQQAQALCAALVGAGVLAATMIPFGVSADRALDVLRRRLTGDTSAPGGETAAWLKPLRAALLEAGERLSADASRSAARLRELEIQARVTEAELRQTASVFDTIRDAVIVTNAYDELTAANAAAARLLGLSLPAALRKPITEAINDTTLIGHIRDARNRVASGDRLQVDHTITLGDVATLEGEPRTAGTIDADGAAPTRRRTETLHFELTLTGLPVLGAGQPGGVVAILRDVTREKEVSQMKSDFVSQVSHELRTPLASINAYVEMLVDGEAKDEASRAEFYGVIKSEADRLRRLIDNMLNISRIEAGIFSLERSEVDFAALARQAVEIMQPQAQLKRITLIQKSGPLVYTAQADRDMMHQVVLNLVSNAVKYTPEGGRVTVAVENDDATRSVLVTVSDTGLGIPPDAMPRLFDKFYRIENYKRVASGTGLGLNLVKHIVETVHGGQVGVSSKVGMGSRFWFTIPFVPAARAAA